MGASCKKESIITPQDDIPVFYFNGIVNGKPTKYEAGNNNCYMHTDFYKDSTFWLRGIFGDQNCIGCSSTIGIEFSDTKIRTTGFIDDIFSTLHTGSYSFYTENTAPVMRYIFNTDSLIRIQPNQSYDWSFGNGDTASGATITKDLAPGHYNEVALKITNNNTGCSSRIENLINTSLGAVDPNFNYTMTNANTVKFSYGGNNKLVWFFDNGLIIDSNPEPEVSFIPGIHTVCLNITNMANNTQATFCRQFNISSAGMCLAGYGYTRELITNDIFSKIKISYTNDSGVRYVNYISTQPSSSNFKVLEVISYDNNEKGEATMKLKIAFTCKVFNVNNQSDAMEISSNDCVLAVAFPSH